MLVEAFSGIIMLKKASQQNDRSRQLIAIFFLVTALSTVLRIALTFICPSVPDDSNLLSVSALVLGFLVYFTLLLYPIEVLRPRWLDMKKVLFIISPWLVLVVLLATVAPFGIMQISSTREIIENLNRTDVFLRVIMSLIFIPYGIWLIFMQYNWRSSSAPIAWIRTVVCIAMVMTLTFSFNRFFTGRLGIYIHIFLYLVLTCVILVLELKVRFRVPDDRRFTGPAMPSFPSMLQPAFPVENKQAAYESARQETADKVVAKLEAAMRNPEIWQNPDLSRSELCNIIGTNANYLQKAIKSMGYASYSDMINRKRVAFVCKELESGRARNIQDIFYKAGYRSRVTAWRNFTAITGTSPAMWDTGSESASDNPFASRNK